VAPAPLPLPPLPHLLHCTVSHCIAAGRETLWPCPTLPLLHCPISYTALYRTALRQGEEDTCGDQGAYEDREMCTLWMELCTGELYDTIIEPHRDAGGALLVSTQPPRTPSLALEGRMQCCPEPCDLGPAAWVEHVHALRYCTC